VLEFLFLHNHGCQIDQIKLRWTSFQFWQQGMLSSEQAAVRVRAFDLVLNLGVHAHLLEPMQSEDQASREEASSVPQSAPLNGGSFSLLPEIGTLPSGDRGRLYPSGVHEENGGLKASIEKPERGTPLGVGEFEVWLLDILCEMLLFLVQVQIFFLIPCEVLELSFREILSAIMFKEILMI
jgi:hypothetical protein